MMRFISILCLIMCFTSTSRADWPARVFAPYVYLGADDSFEITRCDDACGQKFYTLAFIIKGKDGKPAWDGRMGLDQHIYAPQIDAIRQRGGDVIVSFGGAGGTEMALADKDADALADDYQRVIDAYHLTWLDFDIEGDALANKLANQRRNEALAKLQARNPALIFTYTLPVDPNGISGDAQALLADAKAKGVKIKSANVMTMDFGAHFSKGKKMSDVSIASALKAHEQCQAIDPSIQIGLCPMIGQNDEKGEIFTTDDARALRDWALAQPWVCSTSFWASNRDSGKSVGNDNTRSGIAQQPWDFTNVFKTFTVSRAAK
jgi:chitinase